MVTAPTLEAGAEWVRHVLGAECKPGGAHVRMGTHNLLLRLANELYLEGIAVDPAAFAVSQSRWFGLDRLPQESEPRLGAWVARTDNLDAAMAANSEPIGPIEPMSRGNLTWRITVPRDGSLPFGGAGPMLIQWESDFHPASRLPDDGFSLVRLEVTCPQVNRLKTMLEAIEFQGPLSMGSSESIALTAVIKAPFGIRRLTSTLGNG